MVFYLLDISLNQELVDLQRLSNFLLSSPCLLQISWHQREIHFQYQLSLPVIENNKK
jgi:hypothetical protein